MTNDRNKGREAERSRGQLKVESKWTEESSKRRGDPPGRRINHRKELKNSKKMLERLMMRVRGTNRSKCSHAKKRPRQKTQYQ